jgi:C4-dicarboxylate transporter DctM subunit
VPSLLAIPLFVLAGELMNVGGIANRLLKLANSVIGNISGGLAIVTIISCMFFGAISGSAVATAATFGAIMIPAMMRSGYNPSFSGAVVATASPLGSIIPPSISLILYGVLSNTSIADLYLVGIPAGIMIGIALLIVAYIISKKQGYKDQLEPFHVKNVFSALREAVWALGTPVILIGGIFGGIFTPTESAVVAVVYAIIIGLFIYKDLKWKDILAIFFRSAKTSAEIMFIISNAMLFAFVLTYERIPQTIVEAFMSLSDNPVVILLVINLILLFVGTFMETSAILIIIVPLFLPVISQIGVDPVLFGIIVTINTAIGMATPPFGITLYTASSIGKLRVEKVAYWSLLPILAMIVVMFIITYVPNSVLFILD